jgi:hypothetical protein
LDSSRTPFSLHAPIKANKKVVDKARQLIAAPELIGPAHTIRVQFNGNFARIRTDSFSSAQPITQDLAAGAENMVVGH